MKIIKEQYDLFIKNGLENETIIKKCKGDIFQLSKVQKENYEDKDYERFAKNRKNLLRRVIAYTKQRKKEELTGEGK